MNLVFYNAVILGQVKIVKDMLAKDCDLVKSITKEAKTPLYLAAENKHFEIVDVLLNYGANPLHGCGRTTPLKVAFDKGDITIIKRLLQTGKYSIPLDTLTLVYEALNFGHIDVAKERIENLKDCFITETGNRQLHLIGPEKYM